MKLTAVLKERSSATADFPAGWSKVIRDAGIKGENASH
jgi:hypothetical protein